MIVCSECRTEASPSDEACYRCGSTARAEVDDRNAVVAWMGDPSQRCPECGQHADPLLFRRYRRVVGMVILDSIHNRAGYFCEACRKRLFKQHIGLTVLLGWWGVLALVMRNPYAIAVNLKSLWAPPRNAKKYGAVTLESPSVEQEPAYLTR
jgi:hypothetical protein